MSEDRANGTGEHIGNQAGEPTRKATRKPTRKPASEPRAKRSLNLSLTPETIERLTVHALRTGQTLSELVTELADTHCRRWHIASTPIRGSSE